MATAAQIAANIANAQHSTGPRSDEGKQRAAANSIKHGLNGTFAVLGHENHSEFDVLVHSLLEEFEVETPHERFLVEQMAQASWRISRIDRIENAALDQIVMAGNPELDADARIAAHLLANGVAILTSLQRYRTAAQNAYAKFFKLLCDSRGVRIARRATADIDKSIGLIVNAPMPVAPSAYTGPRTTPGQNPLRL